MCLEQKWVVGGRGSEAKNPKGFPLNGLAWGLSWSLGGDGALCGIDPDPLDEARISGVESKGVVQKETVGSPFISRQIMSHWLLRGRL